MKQIKFTIRALAFIAFLIIGFSNFSAYAQDYEFEDEVCYPWIEDCDESAENYDEDSYGDSSEINSDLINNIKSPEQVLMEIMGDESGLDSFSTGQHPDAPADYLTPGVGTISSPIYYALDLFKLLGGTLALIYVLIMAIKLITIASEDEFDKTKRGLFMGIVGFIVIQAAPIIVEKVFFGEQGEVLSSEMTAQEFAEEGVSQLRGIIGLINAFLASIAVVMIIFRGMKLISTVGNSDEMETAKRHIGYAVAGLIVVGLSEVVIRGFIFPDNGDSLPSLERGKQLIIMATNFIAGFITLLSFVALFYGGYNYVISTGNDDAKEKFKSIIISVVLAILLSAGAFAAVNTLIQVNDTISPQIEENNN